MLISFDVLLEWREHFKLGHPISNVIMAKLTFLNQKLEQVHLQHQGLPLLSINCYTILFSHVFLFLHNAMGSYFPHNSHEENKI